MVKNTKGGSGHKGQARKHTGNPVSYKLRLSEDALEQYAFIEKRLGGEFCQVKCQDGQSRLCVIRGKFRGTRGKRDSFITNDSWILVGLRDWETKKENSDKLEKCDLLEVYKDADKLKLRNIPGMDWSMFITNDNIMSSLSGKNEDDIIFSNDAGEQEYAAALSSGSGLKKITKLESVKEDEDNSDNKEEEEINIDDI